MEKLNTPNKLTILRILFVLFLVLVSYMNISIVIKNIILAIIFLVASFTDYIDRTSSKKE